jgi:predicted amidophosphoribosyltransferase
MDNPFIRTSAGLWCPNCQERIDEFWPVNCDHCGYPSPDHERFDEPDDYDVIEWRTA